jgi:quercetin dioxygenase-like cupin family protein
MQDYDRPVLTRWEDIPFDRMRGSITRRFVTSNKMMIAQVNFAKGDAVPVHRHPNEQFVYVLTGALRFLLGDEQADEIIVRAGEVILIPSDFAHSAAALEDTLELDIFCPPRADWLDGSDDYMRK